MVPIVILEMIDFDGKIIKMHFFSNKFYNFYSTSLTSWIFIIKHLSFCQWLLNMVSGPKFRSNLIPKAIRIDLSSWNMIMLST